MESQISSSGVTIYSPEPNCRGGGFIKQGGVGILLQIYRLGGDNK